ncbi:MAG: hypothetical protein ACYS1C_10285 [Planctomycetota bacterium]
MAFGVRLFLLTKVPHEYVIPHTRWEMEAVAVSLAQTGQFADPYALPTGPTAHLPPVLPGILGLIFRVFGLTLVAGYVAWLLRIAICSTMYAMMPWLAGRLGIGRPAGLLGGLAGAFMARWPGHGEALSAIALALLMVAFLRRWTSAGSSVAGSLLLGLAIGVAFHVQPVLLPVILGCVAFEVWWSKDRRKWKLTSVMVVGAVLACLPWGLRNYRTFDAVFFIRSNLGLELRMGNHEGAAAAMDLMDMRDEPRHPRTHVEEARLVLERGEVGYMRQAGREALGWIRRHPADFLQLTGERVVHFWFGPLHRPLGALAVTGLTILALLGAWLTLPALTLPQRSALLIPVGTFPLIYYVLPYMFRYREPVNWILLMFAGAAVVYWIGGRSAGAGRAKAGRSGLPTAPLT